MAKKKDFTVLIVGRENVGKSSIFNRLVEQNRAIVDDFPGVTRDKLYGEVKWLGKEFRLIDTGGILFDGRDLIKNRVIETIQDIIHEADLVMFVVDLKAGIISEDLRIFDFIKKNNSNYIVVVNKADNADKLQEMYEFYNLGVDMLFPVSAAHSTGLDDLLDYVIEQIPEGRSRTESEKPVNIAIVGKENVGKSSLFNALVKEERSIVTEIPGTTRDSVDSMVKAQGRELMFIDTAGVKKRKRIKEKAEEYSIGRAFANVKRCDIAVHVIDAEEGLHEMDKRILGYAYEHYKAVILVINKWDLIKKEEKEELRKKYNEYMRKSLKFLRFAPIIFISAKENRNIHKVIDVVFYVEKQYNLRVKTSVLNRIFAEALSQRPPSSKKGNLKIYYITQVGTAPPTFTLFVNKEERLHLSYMRYLENRIRETFGFEGAPLKMKVKQKEQKDKGR